MTVQKQGFIPLNKTNPYKDGQGRYLTYGLFKEFATSPTVPAPYTLEQAKQIYLEARDPIEYSAAMTLLNSWDHWQRLTSCDWFQPIIEEWRNELDLKLKSEAMEIMVAQAQGTGPSALNAAKWIAEQGWKGKQTKGRPKKEDIERQARIEAQMNHRVDQHYDNLITKPKVN